MALTISDTPVPLAADSQGVMRVGGTRVTLDSVVYAFTQGATAEEIVYKFPSLDLADVYAVIGYYLRHREEVDEYLRHQEEWEKRVRDQVRSRFDQTGIRERLLARKRHEE